MKWKLKGARLISALTRHWSMHLQDKDFVRKLKRYLKSYRKQGMSLMSMPTMHLWKLTGSISLCDDIINKYPSITLLQETFYPRTVLYFWIFFFLLLECQSPLYLALITVEALPFVVSQHVWYQHIPLLKSALGDILPTWPHKRL